MLLVVVDVENALVEFHHTPTLLERKYYRRSLREFCSDFGDKVQRLSLIIVIVHLGDSRSNTKLLCG